MRQQRSVTALVPRSTVHTHCNPWRILGVNSIYFREDEIFKFEIPVMKHRKPNNVKADRTKIQKCFVKKNKKLVIEFKRGKQAHCADTYLIRETATERTIDWCEEYKLNKIILLNYTERGKQLRKIELRKTAININIVTIFYHTLLTYLFIASLFRCSSIILFYSICTLHTSLYFSLWQFLSLNRYRHKGPVYLY